MIGTLFKVHDILTPRDGHRGHGRGGTVDTCVPLLNHTRFLSHKYHVRFHQRPGDFADTFGRRGGDFQFQRAFRRFANVVDAKKTILATRGEMQCILKLHSNIRFAMEVCWKKRPLTAEKSTLFTTCLCLNSYNSFPELRDHNLAEKSPEPVAANVRVNLSTFADQTAPLWPWKDPIQSPVSPFLICGVLSTSTK